MLRRVQSAVYTCLCVWLVLTTSEVSGQQCDLQLKANQTSFIQQDALQGSGSCTWTISVETERDDLLEFTVVHLVFEEMNLTSQVECDPSNSIIVYDGDTSGRILGLVCGNNESFSTFQSSDNMMTLQYPASQISDTYSFRIKYAYALVSKCSSTVTAVSDTEYSLVTPRYPAGTRLALDCTWSIRPTSDTKRIRVDIEATTSHCPDVNMTIYGNGFRKLDTWCPGDSSIYQSFEGILFFRFDFAAGTALKLTYRLLEESPCKGTFNLTKEIQFLQTPNYPQPYPSFTECQWQIDNRMRENGSLRIDVIDMDIEDTPDCTAESLVIKRDRYNSDDVMHKTCSGTPTFYAYDYSTIIVFRSWKSANSRKGIRIKFYHGEAEPCGGDLVASGTAREIRSPGYPFVYPNSINCVWRLSPSDPINNVKIKFVDVDLFTAFTSCRNDRLEIRDGGSTSSSLLSEVCSDGTSDIQGNEGNLTVIFKTDNNYGEKGFLITYEETSDIPPVFHEVDASFDERTIISPRYPDGQVRDLNITWHMTTRYNSNAVLLSFTDVNMGDDCTDNFIRVYQGQTSSSKSTTLCGRDSEVFLSRDLTVVLKTDSELRAIGFKAYYESKFGSLLKTGGCLGTTRTETAYSVSKDTIETPNYPNKYPNFVDCDYVIKAVLEDYRLRVFIEDIDFVDDEECDKDYFEIFDGQNTTDKSLGIFCRNSTDVVESTGRYVHITFTSDGKHSGLGGRISFIAISSTGETGTSYLWVVILVCVLGGLVIVGYVVYYVLKKKRQGSAPI